MAICVYMSVIYTIPASMGDDLALVFTAICCILVLPRKHKYTNVPLLRSQHEACVCVGRRKNMEPTTFVKFLQPTMCCGIRGDVDNHIGWSYLFEKKVEQLSTHAGVSMRVLGTNALNMMLVLSDVHGCYDTQLLVILVYYPITRVGDLLRGENILVSLQNLSDLFCVHALHGCHVCFVHKHVLDTCCPVNTNIFAPDSYGDTHVLLVVYKGQTRRWVYAFQFNLLFTHNRP